MVSRCSELEGRAVILAVEAAQFESLLWTGDS